MQLNDLSVMVVDDFPAMRKLLVKALRQMGLTRISEARDGIEAVKLLEQQQVDLLVSDWNMPDMGGLELLQWVRGHYSFARLPFLMVTSKGQQLDVVQAVRAGVDSYVVKPFTHEILEAKVNKLAGQAHQFAVARAAAKEAEAAVRDEAERQAMREIAEEPETPLAPDEPNQEQPADG